MEKITEEVIKQTIREKYPKVVVLNSGVSIDDPYCEFKRSAAEFGYSIASEEIEKLKYHNKELHDRLQARINMTVENEREIERLKAELEEIEDRKNNPYWYWPQCDVDGCEGVSCFNGMGWKETGYWCLCSKHSQEFRDGKPQPKMRQSAIDKEATRDKETGCLPNPAQTSTTSKQAPPQ